MDAQTFDGVAAVTQGDTVFSMWKAPARAERQQWLIDCVEAHSATLPEPIFHFMLVLPSSDPPDAESRKLFQAHLKKMDKKLTRLVCVAIGDSIRISLVRTIGRTILMLAGKSDVLSLVATVNQGIDELNKAKGPKTPSAQDVHAAVKAMAAALDVQL